MASLTGTKIKDTYDGLLKTTDNGVLGASEKLITDGLGNSSGVYLGTSGDVGIGASTPLAKTHVKSGSSGFSGALNTNYDDLAIEGSGNIGMTFLTPNSNNAGIAFSDEDADVQGSIVYRHSVDAMTFNTSATERIRIDSSGNVGIGVTPLTKLHLYDTTSASVVLRIQGSTTSSTGIQFGDTDLSTIGRIIYDNSDNSMQFRTNSLERMRILSSGGLTFNGDTSTSNALDDYEEGEFTPEVADAATGGNVAAGGTYAGVYTKIGRQVTVVIQAANIDTTGMTSANELWFRNLPFTSGGFTGSPLWIGAIRVSAITATANSLGFVSNMAENASSFRIMENIDLLNSSALLVSKINSGSSDIWVTLTYFV